MPASSLFRALALFAAVPLALASACSSTPSASGSHDGGADVTTTGCTSDTQCVAKLPTTTPPGCASATCDKLRGACVFAAKDEDGDGHTAAQCSAPGVTIQTGDDCNDQDKNLYPGHPESCSGAVDGGAAPPGFCAGLWSCLADGTESPCTATLTCVHQACVKGACTGECAPGDSQCVTTAGASSEQTCGTDGTWGTPTACVMQTCVLTGTTAKCTGSCSEGTFACTGAQLQKCDDTGTLQNDGAPCAGSTPACSVTSPTMGGCVAGCTIGGSVYVDGTVNPNNKCQVCTASTSTTAWSNVADNTSCGNGQVCGGGECGTQCIIGGTVVTSGGQNPANACQSCQPGESTTVWTDLTSGTPCATGEVCNGSNPATCTAGCWIDGAFYAPPRRRTAAARCARRARAQVRGPT